MRPWILLPLALAGCAHHGPQQAVADPRSWQKMVSDPDRKRVAGLWDAWARGLGQVRAAGDTAGLKALGPLVDPEAATQGPPPPPGSYACRTVKLGQALVTMLPVPCVIDDRAGNLWFRQAGGAQRLIGRLYPDGGRQVFLGSLRLAMEPGSMGYGADPERDQVGVLRPLGPGRWRLELPWPRWEASLVVVEITPA